MSNKLKILVVDDSPNVLTVVSSLLDEEGYQVETCPEIDQALDRLKKSKPDLVLLDVMMPSVEGMDGFALCSRIKEAPETSNIPVIFLTGIATDSSKSEEELREISGADDFINKPFDPGDLIKRVKLHLKERDS